MEEENQPQYRISVIDAVCILVVALFYDALQALLIAVGIGFLVNWLITIFAWLTFYLWFKLKGVDFSNWKRGGTMGISAIIEFFPLLNALPTWILACLILIINVRGEDFLAHQAPDLAKLAGIAKTTTKK